MSTDPTTFRAWIIRHGKEDSPLGDLARDVYNDRTCWHGHTYQGLKEHMTRTHGACDAALDILNAAHRLYQATKHDHEES